ncbi:MAG: class I SAM-dependent methyltransferase [bacterium]
MVKKNRNGYIPALRYDWLTSVYDPLLRWAIRESTFKSDLVEQAQIRKGHKVLDLGCGTGTLTVLIKKVHPESEVAALDGDPKALQIAGAKTVKACVDVALHHGMAFELPYADGSFDRVLSSLLFHHLTRESKRRTLREVFRVLRPGAELHVADWGKAQNPFMRLAFFAVQLLDGFETTSDNVRGRLIPLMQGTGFIGVVETSRMMTAFGTLSFSRAVKPPSVP